MSDVHDRIAADIKDNEVLLFMKGTPVFPQCGFSAAVVGILSELGVKFKAVDVLKDPEVRQGIKEFSNWPTIPQLYVKGEFVGGCDILKEMYEEGELEKFFAEKGIAREAA
jgi:monothiol glutaredoxin